MSKKKSVESTLDTHESLLIILEERFQNNMHRHQDIRWEDVAHRLEISSDKISSLQAMESTGGEPDVIGCNPDTGEVMFADCSMESPKGRRSLCYDRAALEARKEHKPKHNAVNMAAEMGIEIMTEKEYRQLQKLENFDTKTSSWLKTPSAIRKHGGAIFGDFRYDHVFIYHNGAQSYYAARGFRGMIKV